MELFKLPASTETTLREKYAPREIIYSTTTMRGGGVREIQETESDCSGESERRRRRRRADRSDQKEVFPFAWPEFRPSEPTV